MLQVFLVDPEQRIRELEARVAELALANVIFVETSVFAKVLGNLKRTWSYYQ